MFGIGKKDKEEKAESKGDAAADDKKDSGDKGAKGADSKAKSGGGDNDSGDKAEICSMKRGDYMIHVYIEQAKELKVDAESTVDPIVEVSVLGERKFSTALDDINNTGVALWNEHIFFEPKNVDEDRLAMGKIEVKLLDKGFFKDALIGYYEFDLTYIYQMEQHAMQHKWVVLSNPESEDFGEVTGYLKLSITVCGSGDEQIGIEEDPNPEKEDLLQPPEIKPEYYQLYIKFFTAQKIVPMDTVLIGDNKIDAYIRFDYRSSKLKTKVLVQKEGGEIHWNQMFAVPAQLPIMGGKLTFKVFDEDTVSDELVGSFTLNAKDIIETRNGQFFWKNIYGSPLDVSGNATKRMNEDPSLGSLWKGRILMQVTAEKTDKPFLKLMDIDPEEIE